MNILIAAGGTGGHIFPALSLAQALKRKSQDNKIIFVSSQRKLELELFDKYNCDYKILKLITPPGKLSWPLLLFLLQFIRAIVVSYGLIKELKPKVVIGFGSYTSVAVILAAKLSAVGGKVIPVIIHEQNVYPGRANRFLSILADKIALSFQESANFFKQKQKLVVTGNPLRFAGGNNDKESARRHFALELDKFTVLIIGGSQGAHFLNQILAEVIKLLSVEEKNKLQFIHLTGREDFLGLKQTYQAHKVMAAVYSFLDEMDRAYSASDLVISRAGATTIAEICAKGLPSILIPYPYAGGHQRFNALVLKNRSAGVVLEQKSLNAEILRTNLLNLMNDKKRLEEMSAKSFTLSFQAAGENLAKEALSLC